MDAQPHAQLKQTTSVIFLDFMINVIKLVEQEALISIMAFKNATTRTGAIDGLITLMEPRTVAIFFAESREVFHV